MENPWVLEEVIADRIVVVLNEMLALDKKATEQLIFGPYVSCNKKLAEHPSVQVRQLDENKWGVRVMGLLNGLAGTYSDGFGRVAANFEVRCEEHGISEKGKVVGDSCSRCGKPLVLGKLINFIRLAPEKHEGKKRE